MTTQLKVIEGLDSREFETEVNGYLSSGWELHGEMNVFPHKHNDPNGLIYIQAITKKLSAGRNLERDKL